MSDLNDAPASVLVTRELLKTPLVQSLLRDCLSQDSDAAPAMAQALLEDDPQLVLDLAAALPSRINAAGQAAGLLAEALERFPTTLTREAAEQWMVALDTDMLGQKIGSLEAALYRHLWHDPQSRQALLAALTRGIRAGVGGLGQRLEQDPASVTGPAEEAISALVDGLDSGQIRRVLQLGLEAWAEPLSRLTGRVMGDPVLVANLVAALPPMANAQLRGLADAVEGLELPAEVLASALFNLLQALDQEQLARLINGLARAVTEVHRGNLILGLHEPRFLAVCGDLLQGLLPRLDGELLEAAAGALAQDMETVFGAWEALASRRPELGPGRLTAALARAFAPLFPRARRVAARLVPEHAGALAGALVAGFVGAVERDPELVGRTLSGAVAGVEPERLERAVTSSLEQVGEIFISRPELREAVTGPVIVALQGLAMQYMRALGERLRGGPGKEGTGPAGSPLEAPKESVSRRLVGRLMRRGSKR